MIPLRLPVAPGPPHAHLTTHVQGLVRVRRSQQWDYIAEETFFASSAIRCSSFDENGYAWIGDDSGRVKVLRFGGEDAKLGAIQLLFVVFMFSFNDHCL